jgi:hypothetical protein
MCGSGRRELKLFKCQNCASLLYFENSACQKCGLTTGYIPELEVLSAVEPDGVNWTALADPGQPYQFCANWERHACNWLLKSGTSETYCRACQHNRTIPDVTDSINHALWITMERAKRRLFYSLMKLHLPLPLPNLGNPHPLEFEFLTDAPGKRVMTGHDNGNITISLREADDAEREKLRTSMHEPYRTLLGHFRHEVGHFYWDILVRDGGQNTSELDGSELDRCRAVFGDDSLDYDQALAQYYRSGTAPDWQTSYVSAYATMHPWEDFAETWAHYLHIVDTLEMAYAFGITVSPRIGGDEALQATIDRNPYKAESIEELVAAWLPISFAANSLNRTMGQPDLYPFIISQPAIAKLGYIHQLIHNNSLRA